MKSSKATSTYSIIMSSVTYQSPCKQTPTPTQFDTFVRWLRLKKYRIEVTYGVYVFTPMEKVMFWTLFCILFTFISAAIVLYTHRSLTLFVRAGASHINSRISSGDLILTAKHAATGLTTSAQTRGAEKAAELMDGMAKNSQVA
ncbi:hypothetical protein E0Z10_g5112 [Xylaria hypoxylon]|uniref:Uncharacterized protein n=1 Tax=Xylaria hypoxylon TaxID=37992 RepID=A0A4Z0YI78_9PEZI|nr:hypothetical protein E0Z10_g5112 [Xylaria hypoxylon]